MVSLLWQYLSYKLRSSEFQTIGLLNKNKLKIFLTTFRAVKFYMNFCPNACILPIHFFA